ncbi:MAG: hypothetical protein PHI12_07350 [Dehalococcoidales bacterium]|nr:hypothetical protein [Dehalococcoidales bacterium]
MSLETKGGGVTTLSALTIDADKDWVLKGISNLKEVVAGMVTGDLIQFDGVGINILSPGPIGTILTTNGIGALSTWSHP